jgi:hypothetical protein
MVLSISFAIMLLVSLREFHRVDVSTALNGKTPNERFAA